MLAPNKAPQLTHKSVAPIVAMLLAPTELERYIAGEIDRGLTTYY